MVFDGGIRNSLRGTTTVGSSTSLRGMAKTGETKQTTRSQQTQTRATSAPRQTSAPQQIEHANTKPLTEEQKAAKAEAHQQANNDVAVAKSTSQLTQAGFKRSGDSYTLKTDDTFSSVKVNEQGEIEMVLCQEGNPTDEDYANYDALRSPVLTQVGDTEDFDFGDASGSTTNYTYLDNEGNECKAKKEVFKNSNQEVTTFTYYNTEGKETSAKYVTITPDRQTMEDSANGIKMKGGSVEVNYVKFNDDGDREFLMTKFGNQELAQLSTLDYSKNSDIAKGLNILRELRPDNDSYNSLIDGMFGDRVTDMGMLRDGGTRRIEIISSEADKSYPYRASSQEPIEVKDEDTVGITVPVRLADDGASVIIYNRKTGQEERYNQQGELIQ